jgi:hypothetical protein
MPPQVPAEDGLWMVGLDPRSKEPASLGVLGPLEVRVGEHVRGPGVVGVTLERPLG